MPATTMTSVDPILKEIYEPRVRDQLMSEVIGMKRIEKTSEGVVSDPVGGKYVKFATRVRRNHGIGARNEYEALPAGRTQGYVAGQIKLTHFYGAIELSGQTFELAETDAQAFASALDQEMEGLTEGLAKDMGRQFYGTSIGKMAVTNAAGSTTTLVMSNAQAVHMEMDMILDIYNGADAIQVSGAVISNIQKDVPGVGSTTVTFGPAAGGASASGWYVTRDDSRAKEIPGLTEIVANTGILHTIDPATNPLWKSEMDAPGADRPLSESLMIDMCDRIKTNGGKTTVIFSPLGVRRAYFNLLVQQRRYTNTKEFTGGFTGLVFVTDWGEIPVVSDFQAPAQTMWFLNEKEIKLYQAGDWSWMDRDGSKWRMVTNAPAGGGPVQDFDAYKATMFKYFTMGTHRRNSHGVMTRILEG